MIATLAGAVHGGALIAFALLFALRARIPHVRSEDLVRVYRSFGAGFGLSLGSLILASLIEWPARVNPGAGLPDAFALRWDSPTMQVLSARALVFFMYWVNYVALEIWTLDDCRLLDREGVVTDRAAYERATGRVARHLGFNALLWVVILLLTGAV